MWQTFLRFCVSAIMSFIVKPLPDLAAWTRFLSRADLPIMQRTANQLRVYQRDQDNVAPREIAAVIARDPLMTLKTLIWVSEQKRLRAKTRAASRSLAGEIETVEAAIVMMGIGPFFRQFSTFETVEEKLKELPAARLGVLRVMSRGVTAAEFASDWAAYRKDLDIQVIFEAALLHDLAEMLTWVFAPELSTRVKNMRDNFPTMRSADIQRNVLGITFNELEVALFQLWQLPNLLQRLTDDAHADTPQVKNVVLAAHVARHLANGSDDPALPDDFVEVAKLLNITPDLAKKRILRQRLELV
jgi:HD-like signal output (HDOD) protein